MKLILTLASLFLVQAGENAYCENNGAKKTYMRGSALSDDIIQVANCYNYCKDGCPKELEIPSAYDDIFHKCKHDYDDENDERAYKWYRCDEPNRLTEWQDIFRSKGWTCDEIH
jgi:hypothetical protein